METFFYANEVEIFLRFSGTPEDNCECYELLIKVPLHTGIAAAGDVMQVVSTQTDEDSTNVRLELIDEKVITFFY